MPSRVAASDAPTAARSSLKRSKAVARTTPAGSGPCHSTRTGRRCSNSSTGGGSDVTSPTSIHGQGRHAAIAF